MSRKAKTILFISLVPFAVILIMAIKFGNLNFVSGMNNEFGDQHLKTAVALIELHKIRTGSYPSAISDLKFIGQWDQIALNSIKYVTNAERSEYFVEVEKGWISKPNFFMEPDFWKGTGYNINLVKDIKEIKFRENLLELLNTMDSGVLYALDPKGGSPEEENTFRGYKILNKSDLNAENLKKVVTSFQAYLKNGNKFETGCFNPRHGLHLLKSKTQYDFVVCFECQKMQIIDPDKQKHWFSFLGDPNILNSILLK